MLSVFDDIAESYNRARPGYPDALIDDVIEIAGVDGRSRILEVGAGTGQATRGFAQRGLPVIALEPGAKLAALARHNLSDHRAVTVIESFFESWPLASPRFDLIVSGQAFHWVDPELRFVKARAALRPGGVLAIFSNIPRRGASDLDKAIDRCYARFAPSLLPKAPLRREALEDQLATCALFQALAVRRYHWERSYSPDEYAELLGTYSEHHRLPIEQRKALFDAIRNAIESGEGRLTVYYESRLIPARSTV